MILAHLPDEDENPLNPKPGDVLRGKYRIKRVLGEGGMGIVVRATHLKLDQDVALKLLKPETAENATVVERFAREAKAAARLKGEHVVRILDVEEGVGGAPFIVMEYLEGTDLDRLVRKNGALSPERATAYALEACEGLAEAHSLGIIHRDVKPANLFLAKTPRGAETVKLLDFGISKAGDDRDPTITEADRVLGSPSFMSPEQVKAARDVDARTDVWSLGVVLYFLLTAKLPFEGVTATAVAARIASEGPDPMDAEIPEGLQAIVLRCLDKDRDQRFASIAELAHALAPYTIGGHERAARVASLAKVPAAPSGSASAPSSATMVASRLTASLSELAAAARVTASVDAPAPVSIDADRDRDRGASEPPRSMPPKRVSPWSRRGLVAVAIAIVAGVAWIAARSPSRTPPSSVSPPSSARPIDSSEALAPAIDAAASATTVTPRASTASASAVSLTKPALRPPAPSPSSTPSTTASAKPVEDPLKLDLK
jgi:eukaryotic-like serine/threonine-protein kinase